MTTVRSIRTEDFAEAKGTEGIQRRLAASGDGFWAGLAIAAPDAASGWHHHSSNDTIVFVVDGRMRIESGPPGDIQGAEAAAGEFLYVPANTVHREVNPEKTSTRVVVIRIGDGEPVVNVDGPTA